MSNEIKICDICGIKLNEYFIDGKTINGPWAYMCIKCHKKLGFGFGIGKGQMFDTKTGKKIKG